MMRPDDASQTLCSVPRSCSCFRQRATTMAMGLRAIAAASVAALSVGAFAHGAELDQEHVASEDAIMRRFAPDSATAASGLSDAASKLTLDSWARHVIDPARPKRAIFVSPGDMDGDGRRDIVSGAWWYRNPGSLTGTWARTAIGAPLNNMAAVRDFDGDGDLDVLGTQGKGSNSNHNFAWARNNGSGAFTVLTNIATGGSGDFLQGVAVARFASGGPLEVALSWHNGGGGIHKLRVPSSSFERHLDVRHRLHHHAKRTAQRRRHRSGRRQGPASGDAVAAQRRILMDPVHPVLDQRATLTETVWQTSTGTAGSMPSSATRPSASRGSSPGTSSLPRQTSAWIEHVISTSVVGPMSLDVADMDADGDRDVIVGEHNLANPASARLFIFENMNGRGTSWTRHTRLYGRRAPRWRPGR